MTRRRPGKPFYATPKASQQTSIWRRKCCGVLSNASCWFWPRHRARLRDQFPGTAGQIRALAKIVGLPNRIVHAYDAVDERLVWDALQMHLPALVQLLETLGTTG